MQIRNVDELLHQDTMDKLGKQVTPLPEKKEPEVSEPEVEKVQIVDVKPPKEEIKDDKLQENVEKPIKEEKKSPSELKDDSNTDEYGNELPPPKTYTEEEVNRMMRERLKRGNHSTEQQQIRTDVAKDFQVDPESEQSWETQLENFIDHTINKREQKKQTEVFQQREQAIQADFESKFSTGMSKYQDFQAIVADKPITDSMMLAMRGMNDPAAFLYAASKNHASELERIARIPDPYQQGAEIGKLEERMKKARNVTSAPKPLNRVAGDMVNDKQVSAKQSIEDRITAHAKSKLRR